MNKNFQKGLITNTLALNFEKIKSTRLKIKNKLTKIQLIKKEIKKNYTHYISKERQNFFGLDSFHFQNKVIELEFSNILQLYHFIDNRIYGDYYKMFIMIDEYLKTNILQQQYDKIKETVNISKYPVYKDLDKQQIYDFDTIHNIHQDIITVIMSMNDIYKENKQIINVHTKQLSFGINIDNYIISHEYMNNNLQSTFKLYENYLSVYHKYHQELLTNYFDKLQLFFNQINHNIVDDSASSEDNSTIDENEDHHLTDEEQQGNDDSEFNIDLSNHKVLQLDKQMIDEDKNNNKYLDTSFNIDENKDNLSNEVLTTGQGQTEETNITENNETNEEQNREDSINIDHSNNIFMDVKKNKKKRKNKNKNKNNNN